MTTPNTLIAAWADRLSRETPGTVAVLLKGSHARGDAGPYSDIDFDVLVSGDSVEEYLTRLDTSETGRLVHISAAVQDLSGWLAEESEPEPWAFGLPVREATKLLWASDEAPRERLDQPYRTHLPGDPELEDFVESLGKVANAMRAGDDLGVRMAAQTLAQLCPSVLRPINPEVWAGSPRTALDAALALPIAPATYREAMRACLGLSDESTTVDDMSQAARRLVTGVLPLLRRYATAITPHLPPDLARYLQDGTLERYVRQIEADP